jgi:NAD(P)-dependent dehydrogenase (short-subunit alcohol dehydrogenase family)
MAVKTWFITGTSAGFGRRLTERLLERGDQVAATLRRPEALAGLAARYPGTLWTAELDVTDTSEVRAVTDRAFAELGRVDVIISNAGYALRGAGEEPDDKQVEQQFATNVLGPMALARAAIPHFRTQGDGHLIQLSSIGGLAAFPFVGYYNATKWAMEGFYEAVHQELAPLGIHATLVEPGGAPTDNQRSSQDPPSQIAAYANARAVQLAAFRSPVGDVTKIADAIIAAGDARNPPRRLVLGSDSFVASRSALAARLSEVEEQEQSARSTDAR